MAPLCACPAFVGGLPLATERGSRHLGYGGGGVGVSVLAWPSAASSLTRVPRLHDRAARPMQRRGSGGRCGGVVVAGPSSYSTSGTPSGAPLGSSVDDCKPAWSSVNGSGPFGAAEDDALTAVSPNVVTFMNNTHRQDLALYALNYGEKLVRPSHVLCWDMHDAGCRFCSGGGGVGRVLLFVSRCRAPLVLLRHVVSGGGTVGAVGGCTLVWHRVYPRPWMSHGY